MRWQAKLLMTAKAERKFHVYKNNEYIHLLPVIDHQITDAPQSSNSII